MITADASTVGCFASNAAFGTAAAGTGKTVTADVVLSGSAAGDYALTASSASGSADIGAKDAAVSANHKTKTYGEANPALDATVSGTVLGDALNYSLATTATPSSGVGDYPISVTLGANPNYTVSKTDNTLSVGAKALTYSATGTKVYGSTADNSHAISFAGFENGQIASVISTPPSCASALGAPAAAAVGSYAISCSGGVAPNYSFSDTTVPGAFSVTKASSSTTVTAAGGTYTGSPIGATVLTTGAGGLSLTTAAISYGGRLTSTYGPSSTAPTNVGDYTATGTYVGDGNHYGSVGTKDYAITKHATTATVSVTPGTQQYTGSVTFAATLSPTSLSPSGTDAPATTVEFLVRGQSMGSKPLAASGGTLTASLTANLVETLAGALAPGSANVTAHLGGINANYVVTDPSTTLTIQPKPSEPVSGSYYTGETVFWTTSTSSSTATLFLSATLQDPCNLYPPGYMICGDMTKATVTFAARNGTTLTNLTGALPVGLVNPGDRSVGSAAASIQYNIGNSTSSELAIAVLVNGYYLGNNPATDTLITVSKPMIGSEIKFAGTQLSNNNTTTPEAGVLRGAAGKKTGVQGDITYNKSGTNPQGKIFIRIVSWYKPDGTLDTSLHTYEIKSTAISTLSIDTLKGTASFTSKATIQDVSGTTAISVDGGALLQISLSTQPVTSSTLNGSLALQINNSTTGAVWFSSAWSGTQTVQTSAVTGVVRIQ